MTEYDDKSMNIKLGRVLGPGMKFFHEYDFGTTTHLALKVVSEGESEFKGKEIQVKPQRTQRCTELKTGKIISSEVSVLSVAKYKFLYFQVILDWINRILYYYSFFYPVNPVRIYKFLYFIFSCLAVAGTVTD